LALANYAELFRSESREHITEINRLLLALEADPSALEPVEGVFRGVHTIKGMAATMGCTGVADLAHVMEDVLDRVRGGGAALQPGLLDVLLRATDALETGVECWADTGDAGAGAAPLLAELRAMLIDRVVAPGVADAWCAPTALLADETTRNGNGPVLRVRLIVSADAPLPGARAFLALREARSIGEVRDAAPSEDELLQPSFGGEIGFRLHTSTPATVVRQRLLGVGDLALLEVGPVASGAVDGAPAADRAAGGHLPGIASSSAPRRYVRMDAERLDALMDRVGELVIVRDRLIRSSAGRDADPVADAIDLVDRLVGQLRDEVLEMRMVPVREVFDRFPRLVRDAARALGRKVELRVEGDDIELDRSLLERIGDPLVHLLRNAIDHGIEHPEERVARGKPESGTLRLSARRERSRVLIRVEDDGRGIDRERVVRKAVALGLIPNAAAVTSDDDALDLITRPGMSTAERVTDVSGRGVGLDVVATQVRSLRGTLEIASRPGQGTSFTLRLPASVGLLRAVLVSVAGATYAIPIAHVAETVEFWAGQIHEIAGNRVAFLRDEALPLIRLGEVLHGGAAELDTLERVPVVIIEIDDQPYGLEVDALLGQQEVVTKPFDATRATRPLFAGATILPDGSPALMLDVAAIVRFGRSPHSVRVYPEER